MKKILSIGLSIIPLISVFSVQIPVSANAAEGRFYENGFYFDCIDGKATVTGYDGSEPYLFIPEQLENGCIVTAVGEEAFRENKSIISVRCESELDRIGDYAFEACSHISSVAFTGNIGTIGKGAFSDCTSLQSVTLSKNVKSIEDGAFFFDKKLTSFGFPKNLESIGEYVFAFSGVANVVMNNKLKAIPDRLFYGCSNLHNIALPKNLEAIGDYAFAKCSELDIESFPDSLDSIGKYSFSNCDFSELHFNGSVIGEGAFASQNDTLEAIDFSDKLKSVGSLAFDSTKITKPVLPDGIDLENGAFAGVITKEYSLKESNDKYIAENGVIFTKDKKTIVYYPQDKGYDTENYEDGQEYIYQIPNSVETIAPYAFCGAVAVSEVKLPDTLTEICSHAFFRAISIKEVTIPNSVKSIGDYAFASISSGEKLSLGSVEKIGDLAFYDFSSEKISVKIPDTITEFNPNAFLGMDIEFQAENNYKVTDGVLYSADGKKLICFPKSEEKSFTVPNGVEEIAYRAFALNNQTTELHIPDTLKKIGSQALEYYVDYSNDYEALCFKDGMCLIGSASKDVKIYADNHNIGVFSKKPAQNIESVTLSGGASADFVISGADISDIVFSSNNDRIAYVSDDGTIMARSKGVTYITAAIGTTYFKCKVKVTSDSGIKYIGFDDSNYYRVTPKTYNLWRENYLKNNPDLVSDYDSIVDEAAMGAYQSEDFYMAMDGVTYNGSDFYKKGLLMFGDNYEPMISMLNHACDTELGRHKNTDSLILYSGAEPYASRLIAGERNSLKDLKAAAGKTFKHPEYVSTTLSPNVAHNFYSKGEGIMYIIYAEKSALDNLPSGLIAAMHSDFEYEQLLAPGSEYEIIDAGVRWFENSEWKDEYDEDIGDYQRYVKLRLLGGKKTPDKLPTPGIKVKNAPKNLYIKQTATVKLGFVNTYDQNAVFSSSNTKAVKISKSGKLTALKKGTATITVSNSETKTSFKVTVSNPTLNKTKLTLKKGKSFTLKIKGKVGTAKFKSKNKKIASVSSKGIIKAKKKGSTVITVNTNGITLKCKLTVK